MYFLWILFYPSSRTTSYWVTFCSYVSVDLTPSLSLFITWSYWTLPSLCLWVSSASPPSLWTLVLYRGVLTSNFITSNPISRHLISFHPVSQCNFMSGFFFFIFSSLMSGNVIFLIRRHSHLSSYHGSPSCLIWSVIISTSHMILDPNLNVISLSHLIISFCHPIYWNLNCIFYSV